MTDLNHAPVQSWDADKIVPYEHNHKKHSDKQVELLAKLIEAKGLINPLVLEEDGTIIAGHGRFLAIQKLGWKKVPVRVMVGISKSDASILRIADNKTVSTEYDTDILARELARLDDGALDLTLLGMDQRELDMLLGDVGEIDTDALVDDIDMAVGLHEQDVDDRAAAADEDVVRLDKAFGFKTVPLPSQKTVTRFMAEIEASTGKVGDAALIDFMGSHLAKAA
jgi:hypothetical protein